MNLQRLLKLKFKITIKKTTKKNPNRKKKNSRIVVCRLNFSRQKLLFDKNLLDKTQGLYIYIYIHTWL